jgi:hypothetical protein
MSDVNTPRTFIFAQSCRLFKAFNGELVQPCTAASRSTDSSTHPLGGSNKGKSTVPAFFCTGQKVMSPRLPCYCSAMGRVLYWSECHGQGAAAITSSSFSSVSDATRILCRVLVAYGKSCCRASGLCCHGSGNKAAPSPDTTAVANMLLWIKVSMQAAGVSISDTPLLLQT